MTALNSNSMTEGHALVPMDGSSVVVLASRGIDDLEECMMEQLTALETQQAFWRVYNRNSPTWAFFTTNDSCAVDLVKPQLMRCIVCHPSGRETMALPTTRGRKGVVLYNKKHGTSAMKRHLHAEHPQAFSRYKALHSSAKPSLITPRQPTKKRSLRSSAEPSLITPRQPTKKRSLRSSAEPSLITPRQPTKKRSLSLPGSVAYVNGDSNPQKEDRLDEI